jgi:hypothetical protein
MTAGMWVCTFVIVLLACTIAVVLIQQHVN